MSHNEVRASQERSRSSHNLVLEFEVADRNGDGRLSPAELSQWHSSGSAEGW